MNNNKARRQSDHVIVEIYWKEKDGSEYHTPVTIKPERIDSHVKKLNERWRLWDGAFCWVRRPVGRPRKVGTKCIK